MTGRDSETEGPTMTGMCERHGPFVGRCVTCGDQGLAYFWKYDGPIQTTPEPPTLKESNAPDYGRGPKEPCAGCGSTDWAWRAGTFGPFPNTCSKCPEPVSACEKCSRPLENPLRLAGPYCVNLECSRRGAVILPPLDLSLRNPCPYILNGSFDEHEGARCELMEGHDGKHRATSLGKTVTWPFTRSRRSEQDRIKCPTCGGDGHRAAPFAANCPAAWAHRFLSQWAAFELAVDPSWSTPEEVDLSMAKREQIG